MRKDTCYTYFMITGCTDPATLLEELEVTPYSVTEREAGKSYDIKIGLCETYSLDVNDMYRVTLAELFGKEETLARLKQDLGLDYYLISVPELYRDNDGAHQILGLDYDIIEFIYLTKTVHDIDYYVL